MLNINNILLDNVRFILYFTKNMNKLLDVVNRRNLLFTHGSGGYLFDEKDEKYLDFVSGIAVNVFGHADPKICDIIADQSRKMMHISNYFRSNESEYAARRLSELTLGGSVFFLNSGTESVETAIKITRKYFHSNGKPEKNEIICFKRSFHGRTLASIAAQGNEKYLEGFEPKMPGFMHAELNNIASVKSLISNKTGGIMLEPIQGEGGVATCTQEFLEELREICNNNDILLIFDEVQCGVGRTGNLYAYQGYNIAPDILITAKGLGAGFPIGAVVCKENVGSVMKPGSHGSTFGCNPMATKIAGYVLDTVSQKEFLENVINQGNKITNIILAIQKKYPDKIIEIRGKGLLIGVQISEQFSNRDLMIVTGNNKLLIPISSYDNIVRILPRLNVSDEEIIDFAEKFERSIAKLKPINT